MLAQLTVPKVDEALEHAEVSAGQVGAGEQLSANAGHDRAQVFAPIYSAVPGPTETLPQTSQTGEG